MMSTADREQLIERWTGAIVECFRPHAIILFGSSARGDARPDSDADLLVVMDIAGTHRAAANAIRRLLHPREIPVDVAVVTPEEFARDRSVVGTLVYPAAREGRMLYCRAA